MKITARPRSRASMTNFSTIAAWWTPSAEVGSSRISTLAPKWMARAIATDWRSPPESVPTAWVGSRMSMPMSAIAWRDDGVRLLLVEAGEGEEALERLAAEEEVPRDAHQRDHAEILEHGGDAVFRRVARAPEAHRRAVDQDLALGRLVDAGEDLDQRRLAGAVVAEEAMDLAGIDLDVDVAERDHRAEMLGDAAELDGRNACSSRASSRRAPWRGCSC